jgi:hypothetical protein
MLPGGIAGESCVVWAIMSRQQAQDLAARCAQCTVLKSIPAATIFPSLSLLWQILCSVALDKRKGTAPVRSGKCATPAKKSKGGMAAMASFPNVPKSQFSIDPTPNIAVMQKDVVGLELKDVTTTLRLKLACIILLL